MDTVPEIRPLVVLMLRPEGRPVAPYEVGVLLATIWWLKALPRTTEPVETLVIAGAEGRPILLLHSSVDSVTPTEQSIEMFKRSAQPCDLHLFAETDHFMFSESNTRVRTVIYDWVEEQPLPVGSESERFGVRQPIGAKWPDDTIYTVFGAHRPEQAP